MPMVRIELFPGRTCEQKARAAREITEAMQRTLGWHLKAAAAAGPARRATVLDAAVAQHIHTGVRLRNPPRDAEL